MHRRRRIVQRLLRIRRSEVATELAAQGNLRHGRACSDRPVFLAAVLLSKPWMPGTRPGMMTLHQGAEPAQLFSPDMIGPNSSQLSPLKRIICNCSSGAKSVVLVLILVPGR